MKKPLIGLLSQADRNYANCVEHSGGIPLLLPSTTDTEIIEQLAEQLDAFLFPGGHDVSPQLYGEAALPECGECSEERDKVESAYLSAVLKYDRPILGICRGIQFLNAALGGTLYQDLPAQHPSEVVHAQTVPADTTVHSMCISADTPLRQLLHTDSIRVNSTHHQAIRRLAPGLRAMAVSQDGLIESIYMPDRRFFWAFQWHPECLFEKDENSRKIFAAFVEAAGEK